jgi:glycosyltransferase involved in cell wall biosynthesis
MKNIGILATARRQNGGTLLYTLSMIDALSRLPAEHYNFVIFVASNNHEFDALGLPIIRLPGLLGLLKSKVQGRNYFNSVDKLIAPVYSIYLLVCGRPFAFTLHDLQERYYPDNFSFLTRLWRKIINSILSARAEHIICESKFVRRDIIHYLRVPEDKVTVVPGPPISMLRDNTFKSDDIKSVRAKFGLPMRYIFYPAQFWPHKNHLRLIDAFSLVLKRYQDCCLVLTGEQRDEFERVFAHVSSLGIESNVLHIGYVEKLELAALYRGAALAVIPTLFESISIPVYEAFSLGTAVCVSNVVALPEQVGDAALLFNPNSSEDIADKICELLSNSELRSKLIERGYRRMESVTHEEYAQNLVEIIDDIG